MIAMIIGQSSGVYDSSKHLHQLSNRIVYDTPIYATVARDNTIIEWD